MEVEEEEEVPHWTGVYILSDPVHSTPHISVQTNSQGSLVWLVLVVMLGGWVGPTLTPSRTKSHPGPSLVFLRAVCGAVWSSRKSSDLSYSVTVLL